MIIIWHTQVIASTLLIMMRVIVLYARVKWVKWVLYVAFTITHVATLALMVEVVRVFYRTSFRRRKQRTMLILRVIADMFYIVSVRVCSSTTAVVVKGLYFYQVRPFILAWYDPDSVSSRFRSNSFSLGSCSSITGNTTAPFSHPQTSNQAPFFPHCIWTACCTSSQRLWCASALVA
jgi:chromate transport protein ChrA